MKQVTIFFPFIIVTVLLAFFFFNNIIKAKQLPVTSSPPTTPRSQPVEEPGSYLSQTKSFGAVEVEAKPKQLAVGKEAIFIIFLNTHSVNLSFDLTQIATLVDNHGNKYKAISWSGGTGGHHLHGELTFEPLKEAIGQITLNLSEIDGVSDNFSFDVGINSNG